MDAVHAQYDRCASYGLLDQLTSSLWVIDNGVLAGYTGCQASERPSILTVEEKKNLPSNRLLEQVRKRAGR